MSPIPMAVTALIVTGAACATTLGSSYMTNTRSDDPLRCELALSDVGNSVRVHAHAHVGKPMNGSYELDIHQRSAGGRSTIRQSGTFSASPGNPAQLGQATVSGSRSTIEADLTVRAGAHERHCSLPR